MSITTESEVTIYRLAAEFDARYPDLTPEEIAVKAVRKLSAEERKALLIGWVADRVDARRRSRAREIEQAALEAQRRGEAETATALLRQSNASCLAELGSVAA